jgi:glycosyltransferase involved in cell wall biosynthesis
VDLEILLITYNRAAELDTTLAALHDSPFAGCRISVLDNASTDGTPAVCAHWAARFEDLRTVRHRRNIGGTPNYLRAVELAEARYTWILADDDELVFSDCQDVLDALERADVDIISVGSPGRADWTPGRTSMRQLLDADERLFHVLTFMPGVIFRTELWTDDDMAEGYRAAADLYPQFPFLARQLERDASVLVSRTEIVRRGGWTTPISHLWWFVRWVRNVRTIEDRAVRRRLIGDVEHTRWRWVTTLAAAIAIERTNRPKEVRAEVAELFRTLEGTQRAWLVVCAPLALGPRGVFRRLRARMRPQAAQLDATSFEGLEER